MVKTVADDLSDQVADAVGKVLQGDISDDKVRHNAFLVGGGALANTIATGLMASNRQSVKDDFEKLIAESVYVYDLACKLSSEDLVGDLRREFCEFLSQKIVADSSSMANAFASTAAIAFHTKSAIRLALD